MTDTAPDPITAFLAEHGLDLTAADPYITKQHAEMAVAYMAEHTPTRYADAFPTRPEVRTWIADVLRQAITASAGRRVISVHTGPSLLLLGSTGTGKTYEAYGAMRFISACGMNTPWKVISAADLYATLRPRHGVDSEAEFRKIAGCRLLAIDDLGAAKTSEWVEEINFRLVNFRYEECLPTLLTSNVEPKRLKDVLGDRVTSRLIEMTTRVVIDGGDRRRAA